LSRGRRPARGPDAKRKKDFLGLPVTLRSVQYLNFLTKVEQLILSFDVLRSGIRRPKLLVTEVPSEIVAACSSLVANRIWVRCALSISSGAPAPYAEHSRRFAEAHHRRRKKYWTLVAEKNESR
jgi:hypothetical protein